MAEDQVQGGAVGTLRGLQPGQPRGEAELALTIDNVKDLGIVVPRLWVLVIIEPVVQELVGGHLDTAVI